MAVFVPGDHVPATALRPYTRPFARKTRTRPARNPTVSLHLIRPARQSRLDRGSRRFPHRHVLRQNVRQNVRARTRTFSTASYATGLGHGRTTARNVCGSAPFGRTMRPRRRRQAPKSRGGTAVRTWRRRGANAIRVHFGRRGNANGPGSYTRIAPRSGRAEIFSSPDSYNLLFDSAVAAKRPGEKSRVASWRKIGLQARHMHTRTARKRSFRCGWWSCRTSARAHPHPAKRYTVRAKCI